MQTASFPRLQRMFGQRDWSPGEPYRIGDRTLGIVTPEGAVLFNDDALFTETTGETFAELKREAEHKQAQILSTAGEIATVMGIVLVLFAIAVLVLRLEAGM